MEGMGSPAVTNISACPAGPAISMLPAGGHIALDPAGRPSRRSSTTHHARASARCGVRASPAGPAPTTITSARTLLLGIDKTGRIIQHDRSAADILAYPRDALLGVEFGNLIVGPSGYDEAIEGLLSAALADREL